MMLPDSKKYILPLDTRICAEAWKDWPTSYASRFHLDPYDRNTLFLFCGKRTDRIKGLLWEGDGFLLLYKRLDTGAFNWPRNSEEALSITPEQYAMLMQGLEIVARHPIEQTGDPKKLY